MKTGTVAVGAVVLILGVVVLVVGFMPSVIGQTGAQSNELGLNTYVIKGGHEQSIGVGLNAGQTLRGTFSQANSSVLFYVMTSVQQNFFGNCVPCNAPSIVNASHPATYNFDVPVNATGTYYLVLDNSYSKISQTVQLTATSTSPATTNYIYVIAGAAVALIGVAVAGFGAASGRRP